MRLPHELHWRGGSSSISLLFLFRNHVLHRHVVILNGHVVLSHCIVLWGHGVPSDRIIGRDHVILNRCGLGRILVDHILQLLFCFLPRLFSFSFILSLVVFSALLLLVILLLPLCRWVRPRCQ